MFPTKNSDSLCEKEAWTGLFLKYFSFRKANVLEASSGVANKTWAKRGGKYQWEGFWLMKSKSWTEKMNLQNYEKLLSSWGQCRNHHVGIPGYWPPKVISTHFCWLATDSTTTFPQSTFEGKTLWRRRLQSYIKYQIYFSNKAGFMGLSP